MKKYSFLVFEPEYEIFLRDIQELGVLHVIEKDQDEISEEQREKMQLVKQFDQALKFLAKREVEATGTDPGKDGLALLEEINDKIEAYNSLIQEMQNLEKERKTVEPWGDFSSELLQKLAEKGVNLRFFTCPSKRIEESWFTRFDMEIVNQDAGLSFFVIMANKEDELEIDADEIPAPSRSAAAIGREIDNIQAQLAELDKLFDQHAANSVKELESARNYILETSFFDKVLSSSEKAAEEKIVALEGWVPAEKVEQLDAYLSGQAVISIAEDPSPEEKPPILLRNKKFPRLFEPIGDLYTLPDYKELDMTPFFAPFFMLFFGFCLGDAGYGILIVLATLILRFKVKPKLKPVMSLGMFLGIATVVMGLLGGTVFGMNLLDTGYTVTENTVNMVVTDDTPGHVVDSLKAMIGTSVEKQDKFLKEVSAHVGEENMKAIQSELVQYAKADYSFLQNFRHFMFNSNKLMALAIALGFIQIIFGMFIQAANKIRMYGFAYALSTFGWIIVILGGVVVYGLNNFGYLSNEMFKPILIGLLVFGGFFIFFFNSPGKNPFLNFGLGIWDTYGMASGLLGDLLSYIRLFALGISSAVLGQVFNELAINFSQGLPIIVSQLVLVLILAFGHGLNFFMAALGSFVHPLRLTFVEFYKNAGFMGGGSKYIPFKKYSE